MISNEGGIIHRTIIEGTNNSYVKIRKRAEIYASGVKEAISWDVVVVGLDPTRNKNTAIRLHNALCKKFGCIGKENP